MKWLSRLLGRQPDSPPVDAASRAAPHPAPPAGGGQAAMPPAAAAGAPFSAPVAAPHAASPLPPLAGWLLQMPVEAMPSLPAADRQAIDLLDQLLARPLMPPELLPRAPAVVPQLIAMLRRPDLPVPALAERIGRDPPLAAEVLRLAGSSFFRSSGPVDDLGQAILRLGTDGLQMAISRVLLRPMYQAPAGTLSARVAPRLWDHADLLSRHGAQAARAQGLSPFDGFLAGLLHDTGWSVLFHALQRAGLSPAGPLSLAGAQELELRAHRLFGMAAQGWAITPAFSAFAADAFRTPLARSTNAMAALLRQAQPACMADLAAAA